MKFYTTPASPEYPAYIPLWPEQAKLSQFIINDLNSQRWSLAKVGQRGGKNCIALEIARLPQFKNVFLFDQHDSYGSHVPIPITFCGPKRIPRSLVEGNVEAPFIILNEAFWIEESYDLFNELREYGPVLAIGSNGPQFEDKRWQLLAGHSYATWEINPGVTRAQLFDALTDPEEIRKAERDYGRF